jgi:crotonobetainyl-CoA:carnitine CoA-transferase CaiB-like acyl-CoA transferase
MRQEQGHAPLMGQQTREILAEVGYAKAEIEAMLKAGAVTESPQK